MNAFNTVNMAAACLLTSTEHAKKLGIPEDRWIYVLGGAGTEESKKCTIRYPPGWSMATAYVISSLGTTELPLQCSNFSFYR